NVGDSFRGSAIPKGRNCARLGSLSHDLVNLVLQGGHVPPNKYIGPHVHGDWPLRVLAKRNAGYLQKCGLFLDAPGVGDYQGRPTLQSKELNIRKRLGEMKFGKID